MLKRKFYLALSLVLVVSMLVGGATYALFSANTTAQQNTFTAGTLALNSERDQGDTVPGPMFYVTAAQGATPSGAAGKYPTNVWAPGDLNVRTLTVYNPTPSSSLDAWLDSVQATLQAESYASMAGKLWVEVYTPSLTNPLINEKVAEGWLSQFLAGPVQMRFPGGARVPCYLTGNRQLQFSVRFDSTAGNDLQDKTLVADFSVNAVQMVNNP